MIPPRPIGKVDHLYLLQSSLVGIQSTDFQMWKPLSTGFYPKKSFPGVPDLLGKIQ